MKVALVYDRVNKWGGAERVLLALHKLYPDAPLYTSVYEKKDAPWADVFDVRTSFLQKLSFARRHHEFFAPFMPIAFETLDFSNFDLVISVTSEAAKGIIVAPQTKHICIVLTPTRYLWSGYDEYFKNPVFKCIAKPITSYLRMWDKVAAQRPDALIAISETVQERIKKYYDRESEVVYPPVTVLSSKYHVSSIKIKNNKNTKYLLPDTSYYLVVSRLSKLTAYKRVDLAIKAANKLSLPLKIVGTGRDEEYYKKMAGPTVEFLGAVDDETLSQLYASAQALIFPGVEDFGLVMVEAQSHGTPVVAYRAGGATEIVKEGKTGEFFDRQSVESLTSVLKSFDKSKYNRIACITNAKRFSFEVFEKQLKALTH